MKPIISSTLIRGLRVRPKSAFVRFGSTKALLASTGGQNNISRDRRKNCGLFSSFHSLTCPNNESGFKTVLVFKRSLNTG